ncbi:MAG: DUF4062 domain-containing protein [Candidatus Thiodiazotropha endolucinida]
MSKKYQIFVSSTYEDLKDQRDQVIKAALEMGHIPVGMEMFSAADEEQWKIITRQIDQSDYYAVIVAHRYGSITEGISYTEKEYDYAVSQGIPAIGFVIEDDVEWPPAYIDTDQQSKDSLDSFKSKVKSKPVGFWKNAEDLHGKFSIALMKLITTNPRPGWARADELIGPDVMKEITRLSSENAALRKEVAFHLDQKDLEEDNKTSELVNILKRNTTRVCVWDNDHEEWSDYQYVTYYSLFSYIAPILITESSTIEVGKQVALSHYRVANTRQEYPIPKNYLEHWLSDLACLELVGPSSRKHSVHDSNEYWSLTQLGREVHADFRRLALLAGINAEDEAEDPEEETTVEE